jgi:hypothetical protein
MGQINVLVLLGISGALYWNARAPLLAGLFLALATVKPQLALGAVAVFGVHALLTRQWRFILGLAGGLSTLLLLLTAVRPIWWQDYGRVLQTPLLAWRTPTLATWARETWPTVPVTPLFFILATFALAAVIYLCLQHRVWEAGVAAAVVVTLLFTLFSWSYDQILLLIPAYQLLGATRSKVVAAALLLINALVFITHYGGSTTSDFDYVWVVPAFTVVYLVGLLSLGPAEQRANSIVELPHRAVR